MIYLVLFYPIINLNLGNTALSYEDTAELYKNIIDVFLEAADKNPVLAKLEFSFASSALLDHLDLVLDAVNKYPDKFCFGSLVDKSVIERTLRSFSEEGDVAIQSFAPAFDNEIYNYIQEHSLNPIIDYCPGIYDLDDFQELQKYFPRMQQIKIFPIEINSTDSLLKSLQAPYPELKQAQYLLRVISPTQNLAANYQLYEKYQTNPNVRLVTCPRDYQKIRQEFLSNKALKILLKVKPRDLGKLVQEIKKYNPDVSLIATGFNRSSIDVSVLENLGVNSVATRVFRNIILDLLAGSISMVEAKNLMLSELSNCVILKPEGFGDPVK